MKSLRTAILFLTLALSTASFAQLSGNGYYRVKNANTGRYITIIDNTGKISYASTSVDLNALQTVKKFENVVNNPGSIIYIRKESGYNQYSLAAQGTDTKQITGETLTIEKNQGSDPATYQAYGTKNGMTVTLSDAQSLKDVTSVTNGTVYPNWYILPVKADVDEQYFGIKPEYQIEDSYWATLLAYFPFRTYSEGMNVYYVTKVQKNKAIYEELTGTIPTGTPVIIKCSTDNASSNRIDIVDETVAAVSGSLLGGVYFCNHVNGHINRLAYDTNTMRVLGKTSSGRIGFVKDREGYLSAKDGINYLPANKAFLNVPEGTADEVELMTQEEYDQWTAGIDDVSTDVKAKLEGTYTLTGIRMTQPTDQLPHGIYIVNGRKVVVK